MPHVKVGHFNFYFIFVTLAVCKNITKSLKEFNMSTRSRIGIRNKDNTITSIYCHWDGYPTWNGKMLLTYYTKREDVEKLI